MAIKYKLIQKGEPGVVGGGTKNGMQTLLPMAKKQ